MPVASPRAKIEEKTKALKGYTKSFRIAIRNDSDPLKQNNKQEKPLHTD